MAAEQPKILIVDDKPENLYALDLLLKQLDVKVVQAMSGSEALNISLEQDFCVAIVDIQMPEMDGYELVELLRSNAGTATLPVIFVSAIFSDEYHHRKGYEAGAVDFMSKPFVPEILISKVKIFIELYQQRSAERQRRRLAESLEHIGRMLTSNLDISQVPIHILEQLFILLPYERGSVLLQDEDKLRMIAQRGFPSTWPKDKLISYQRGDVFYQITTSRSPLLIDDVTKRSDWQQDKDLPLNRSWLGAPLISRGQVIGMLSLTRREAHTFIPDDVMVVSAFASQAAVALENARLYDRLSRFNEELENKVKQRTDELEKANLSLARADKIKSDFIAVSAHELRTPLTLIKGYADLLKGMVTDNEEAFNLVEGILTGEGRLLEIVNNMLDISKIESQVLNVSKESVWLNKVIKDVVSEYKTALKERKLTLTMNDMKDLPVISADPELMHKMFTKLVSNAIKYTPDGGTITIDSNLLPASDFTQGKEMIEITVQDTGIGIDPAHHETIFEKFFQMGQVKLHSTSQTNFKGGGPGLGLAIALGIVQAHGGGIWVESPGHDEETCPGSCFHILLPIDND